MDVKGLQLIKKKTLLPSSLFGTFGDEVVSLAIQHKLDEIEYKQSLAWYLIQSYVRFISYNADAVSA